jgi:Nucleotide-diphospho-sugar transferase
MFMMTNFFKQTSGDQHLQDMLRKAALDDNTIIMTSVNEAWAAENSLLDSFFESFRVGEGTERFLKHIFVVALDAKAYQRCKSLHPYCYFLRQEGLDLSEAQSYMKNVYLDLVWSKLKLQQRILELGYNLLFTVKKNFFFSSKYSLIIYFKYFGIASLKVV